MNTRQGCLAQGAMMGEYKMVDNTLVCVLKMPRVEQKKPLARRRGRGRREEYNFEVPNQDFHIEFQLRGEKWHTLQWTKYVMLSNYSSGREQVDTFDTNNTRNYPRLDFNRVGCYHFETTSIL